MKLSQLMAGIQHSVFEDTTITSITRDSRSVSDGSLFFAISGANIDGHDYAEKALMQGASAIVVEKDLGLKNQIIVANSHTAYALSCSNYFGNPNKQLKLIGITGTNGKTTTTYIVKNILDSLGIKTGLIGTIENLIGDLSIQARYTTPDPFMLHGLFRRMVDAGCEYVVMEVSSHGLDQNRLEGCHFVSSGFSNLTQDHLDYHGTMENYFNAKKKLFDISENAVINIDDSYGRILADILETNITTFSLENSSADCFSDNITFSPKGSEFNISYKNQSCTSKFMQPGYFSVSNATMAILLCVSAGIPFGQAVLGLNNSKEIPGRFEVIHSNADYTIIRDFAHSSDGLEKLLSTVRGFFDGRIITLFGCAGERDRKKRAKMASTVAEYSDIIVMTADNPRSEPINQILEDALSGLENSGKEHYLFEDRLDAIHYTIGKLEKNDYLILVGKGHEDYQVLNYGTINFNERQIVLDYLAKEV